jgi:hypothetical protein
MLKKAHLLRWRWLAVALALTVAGCASVPALETALQQPTPPPILRFGADTFAFPNESRTKNHDKPDLYANYCFVMARAVIQFRQFARFDPTAPTLAPAEYTARVRQATARPPWEDPLPLAARVVIPGYASLHELSTAQEAAVKAGLSGRLWTMLHWTNWRVVFPMPGWQQERVAREMLVELQSGRAVQLLVTNFPTVELNHTVVAFDYRLRAPGDVEFRVYDPNDPYSPGIITFERAARRFVASRLFDTTVGTIRAFRMYHWALL